jgi:hypothetical protein
MVCLGGCAGDDVYGEFDWWPMFYARVLLKDRFVERPPRITMQPQELHGCSLG